MSIWTKLFGKNPVKTHTAQLRFRLPNGGVHNVTHHNVVSSKVWFRVLADTPDFEPVTAIHIFEFADGNQIMYRDDNEYQKLMEFKTE
jgi:hypothetical protein